MRLMSLLIFAAACGAQAEPPAAEAPEAPATEEQEAAAATGDWQHFGDPFSVDEAVPASTVLAAPEEHAEGPVRMKGELAEVCQKMGCWAVVRDDAGHAIRITMKDHAFGIDKQGAGKACDVEGTLVKKAVDPKKLEHYESEGGEHNPEEGKTEAWELVASAVSVGPKG